MNDMAPAPQGGIELPGMDESIVKGRYPKAVLRTQNHGTQYRVYDGDEPLSGWCGNPEAAWRSAVKRVRKESGKS